MGLVASSVVSLLPDVKSLEIFGFAAPALASEFPIRLPTFFFIWTALQSSFIRYITSLIGSEPLRVTTDPALRI
ncbi:hypothetical protein H9L39_13230 [Fusarium oxysporum f. sp. albedinis]|nr:hypothetical protein H9L39_13230 [Fusarium oxysporum f. sp. albedinis]